MERGTIKFGLTRKEVDPLCTTESVALEFLEASNLSDSQVVRPVHKPPGREFQTTSIQKKKHQDFSLRNKLFLTFIRLIHFNTSLKPAFRSLKH